jgi:hypothetical protein
MKKMSSLLALSMSACIAFFLIATDAKAQKNQDRMPSPPGGRGGLPDGVTSRAPRAGEVFNDTNSGKADRWGRDNDGGSSGDNGSNAASRKQDRLTPSPNAVNNPDRRVRTATGYGYGRSTTPKDQSRLTPDRNYSGPTTVYRTITVPEAHPELVGTPNYWNARRMSHIRNNPGLIDPGYGKLAEYYGWYMNRVYETSSPAGRSFLVRNGAAIQRMVDEAIKRDPVGFARLERNPAAFTRFMNEVHTRAYYESGWANLPTSDQWRIARAINVRDYHRYGPTVIGLTPGWFGRNPTQPPERPIQVPSRPVYNQARGVRGITTDGRRYRF